MPKLIEKKLNALSVKRITRPGRHADGSGLYLNVEKSGARSWLLRVTVKGRARTIGLGSVRDVSLAEAREEAARLRKVAKAGGDPLAERDGAEEDDVPTFEAAVRQVYAEHHRAWKNPKHRQQWLNTMRDYAFPVMGHQRVDAIGSADVLKVLQPIWIAKPETRPPRQAKAADRLRLVSGQALSRDRQPCRHDPAGPAEAAGEEGPSRRSALCRASGVSRSSSSLQRQRSGQARAGILDPHGCQDGRSAGRPMG